jgi:hypothetical protein
LAESWTTRIFGAVSRVAVVVVALAIAVVSVADAAEQTVRIIAWGEGLIKGWGLEPADGFPAKLEAALNATGHSATVTYTWHPFSKRAVQ